MLFSFAVQPVFAVYPDTDVVSFMEAKSAGKRADPSPLAFVRPVLWTLFMGFVFFGALVYAWQRRRREGGSDLIRVLASAPVAQGVLVQIIDVAGVLYVVSMSRAGQTVLGEITANEKVSEIRSRVAAESAGISIPPVPFKAALEKFFLRPKPASPPRKEVPRDVRESLLRDALERVRRLNPSEKDRE